MTRYRLPEILGGGEIEAEELWGGCAGGRPEYLVKGSRITITMPEGMPMDAVAPPLPPEPGMQAVVLDKWGYAWQLVMAGRGRWCRTIKDDAVEDWEELNREHGPLIPLLRDPLAEAPELPWEIIDVDGARIRINRATDRFAATVLVGGMIVGLTAGEARPAGLALLWAAAQQEAND